mgnify:FL=1|tara:strand:- start:16 stop:414 length:399 start_codon:yes stop_codon:yes gene_type:complete
MITFVITKDEISKTFECTLEESILSLKTKIIQEFNLKCPYVDIDFQLERPIRSLGKFNLESGILPRPLDTYTFDRYGLDGKEVNATFHEVNDYDNKKYDKKIRHVNLSQKYKQEEEKGPFDLASEDDFPSLS